MRNRRCPQCGYVGQFLAEESRNAFVDYHYCHQCAELWVIDLMNPTEPPRVLHGRRPKSHGVAHENSGCDRASAMQRAIVMEREES
jgi:ssDNA-binding Zn-finger/Zn-ribbon topoisomerase 1